MANLVQTIKGWLNRGESSQLQHELDHETFEESNKLGTHHKEPMFDRIEGVPDERKN